MKKKVTLKEIAKEADVSVATVSYVLNKVANQTISKDTRKRVFEATQKLEYIQNLTAKSLVKGETKLIGILFTTKDSDIVSKYLSYSGFTQRLEQMLFQKGYHVLISHVDLENPQFDIIFERKLDGVFLIDANEATFYSISEKFHYGAPLIVVDSFIDDSLFHKVLIDIEKVILNIKKMGEKEFIILHEPFHNEKMSVKIKNLASIPEENICRPHTEEEMRVFLSQHKNKTIVVFNEFLALLASKYTDPSNIVVIVTQGNSNFAPLASRRIELEASKAEISYRIMMNLLADPFVEGEKYHYIGVNQI